MTREEAIEEVEVAFDIWESEYDTGNDWSKEHEARDMAIKALEKESVLDKIRAEINAMCGDIETIADVLAIIDKHKAEMENEE